MEPPTTSFIHIFLLQWFVHDGGNVTRGTCERHSCSSGTLQQLLLSHQFSSAHNKCHVYQSNNGFTHRAQVPIEEGCLFILQKWKGSFFLLLTVRTLVDNFYLLIFKGNFESFYLIYLKNVSNKDSIFRKLIIRM